MNLSQVDLACSLGIILKQQRRIEAAIEPRGYQGSRENLKIWLVVGSTLSIGCEDGTYVEVNRTQGVNFLKAQIASTIAALKELGVEA